MSISTDFKILEIPVDGVNSYIPPIIINEADNNGRHLKFTPTYEGQPVTGITSARMYYDPRPRDASSIGDYVDGTKDGDGWVFILPPNTFTANVQGIASVSFTDEDGETYTRSMPVDVESGGTKADSQGTRIDRLIATLKQMVNDFTMTAEAETGEAGSQANVTVTKMNGGAYNLKFVIPRGDKGDTGDAATIQLGTVTTGNPGTNAVITNSGTKNTAVFNFTIPRGDVGPAGVNENVPLGSTSGVVAQASDAYPALPRKVQVHGATSGGNSVEPTKLIVAGKNLASVTTNSGNPNLIISDILPPGDYVFSAVGLEQGRFALKANSLDGDDIVPGGSSQPAKFSLTRYTSVFLNMFSADSVENIQIEKGASATRFEQPVRSEVNLPSSISLADGDTLAIDRDGTTQIIHTEGEPTMLDNVSLPELPAPTFNAYTAGGSIQPTVDVDYERDVNLVLEALEAKIAALQVADKTN